MASEAEISLLAAQASLRSGQTLRLRVNGESMSPWLRRGDMILVEMAEAERLSPGDILLTARQGEMVTHRLVAREAGRWYTKGDHFFHADPPLSAGEILGVVVAFECGGKRVGLATNSWRGLNRRLARLSRWEAAWFKIIGRSRPGGWAALWLAAIYRLPLAVAAAWRRFF
jgi:hypothetical protein